MENINNLNLARKWRSKNFDQIVGQELSIKMLKNSLYLGQFFPVYLFSGQRGCGKTTTARVFAAALNCQELATFQKNPKQSSLPCLVCDSCQAMMQGKHPDFFEVDAASHTGVDTIRQIIDASQLLPLMGSKKIYLIDEAHMLSKASFNALLKILEEPPRSVLFILATTDDQKIIDTVKSRCFQLFFKPIEVEPLLAHLTAICQTEKISFDRSGLQLIIEHAQGSARDAINLLEQVRFSSGKVNKESVLSVLGHLDDEKLIQLFEVVLHKGPADLLAFLQHITVEEFSAEFMWTRFTQLARAALWIKHGVEPKQFTQYSAKIKKLTDRCSWVTLNNVLDQLYTHETIFLKTTAKHSLFEMILLQLCQKNKNNNGAPGTPMLSQGSMVSQEEYSAQDGDDEQLDDQEQEDEDDSAGSWQHFLSSIEELDDPLLRSLFSQGRVVKLEGSRLDVEFSHELLFFKDLLEDSMKTWMPVLKAQFSDAIILNPLFTGSQTAVLTKPAMSEFAVTIPIKTVEKKATFDVSTQAQPRYVPRAQSVRTVKNNEQTIDVSDTSAWPKAAMIMRYFPGSITQVKEAVQ